MAAPLSLFQLLMDSLQDARPGMAPDSPAEIARKYPQSWEPDPESGAQTRFPPPVNVPSREERRLSLARFAEQAQPDYQWIVPPRNAGQTTSNGAWSTLSWAPSPMPAPRGKLSAALLGLRGRPIPPPPPPPDLPKIPMPEVPMELKLWWEVMKMHPELFGMSRLDEKPFSKAAENSVNAIQDLFSKGKRSDGSKAGRPATIPEAPSIVPDIPDDASDTPENESSRPTKTKEECEKEKQEALAFCIKAKEEGNKGFFGGKRWDFNKCIKGQLSVGCGGRDPQKSWKKK